MSDRLPIGFMEWWIQWGTAGDPQPMYSSIAAEVLDPGPELPEVIEVMDALNEAVKPITSSLFTVGPGFVLLGTGTGVPPLRNDLTNFVAGTGTGSGYPTNVAYLLKKSSILPGRRGTGRMFLPGVPQGVADQNGFLLEAFFDDLQDAADNIIAAIDAAPNLGNAVLLHDLLRNEDGEPIPGTSLPPSSIFALSAQRQVATQRRRMRP